MRTLLPSIDHAFLTDEFAEDLSASFTEALRSGVDGWIDDNLAFVKPWGFVPEDIKVPTFIWHGSEDLIAPLAHSQWLAKHIPRAVPHLEQGEGHLTITVGAADRMLQELGAYTEVSAVSRFSH